MKKTEPPTARDVMPGPEPWVIAAMDRGETRAIFETVHVASVTRKQPSTIDTYASRYGCDWIPFVKDGNKRLYRPVDVEDYLRRKGRSANEPIDAEAHAA